MKRRNYQTVEHLYRMQKEKVMQYVFALIPQRELAEDIVADVFLEAILKNNWLEAQDEATQLKQLLVIAQRRCDLSKSPEGVMPFCEGTMYSAEIERCYREQEMAVVDRHNVFYSLQDLYREDKEVMLMRYRDGLSVKDIAQVKNISTDAVYKRIQRAKEKVRYYEKHRR